MNVMSASTSCAFQPSANRSRNSTLGMGSSSGVRLYNTVRAGAASRSSARAGECAGPGRAVVGAGGLAHPELDALGPDAIAAPARRARRVAGEARRRLLDLLEEGRARGDGPALLAGGGRNARIRRAREPVGV